MYIILYLYTVIVIVRGFAIRTKGGSRKDFLRNGEAVLQMIGYLF